MTHAKTVYRTLLAAALLGASLSHTATAAQPPENLVAAGKLTYGTAATFAPFEYQQDGKLTGFDIELGELISQRLGLQAAPFNVEFRGLIPALQGKRIDLINSAMYINDERSAQVDFVPYLRIGSEVVVAKGNPKGISGREDVCGQRIAVTLGGIEESRARDDVTRCQGEDRTPPTIVTFPTAQASAMALRVGRADVLYTSTPGAAVLMREVPDTYETSGPTFEADTRLGLAVRKGDTELAAALEEALGQIVASGDYLRLIHAYQLPDSAALLEQ